MLKIRLSRVGRQHIHAYRVVLTEHTQSAKHGYQAILGSWNSDSKKLVIDVAVAKKHLANGAQLSDSLAKICKSQNVSF